MSRAQDGASRAPCRSGLPKVGRSPPGQLAVGAGLRKYFDCPGGGTRASSGQPRAKGADELAGLSRIERFAAAGFASVARSASVIRPRPDILNVVDIWQQQSAPL